jgi:hypothetical protein
MAVPHDAVATVGQSQVLPPGDEGVGFRDQLLGPAFGGLRRGSVVRPRAGLRDRWGCHERDEDDGSPWLAPMPKEMGVRVFDCGAAHFSRGESDTVLEVLESSV